MSFQSLIEQKIRSLGLEYSITDRELRTTCLNPDHNDTSPSFFINLDSGINHCFSCGYAVNPSVIIDCDEEQAEEILHRAKYNYVETLMTEDDTPKEVKEFFLPTKAYDIDRDWRGINKTLLQSLGAYYTEAGRFSGRLIFPIHKEDILQGFDARIVNPNAVPEAVDDVKWLRPKGMEVQKIVYPYNIIKDMDCSHIVLCEGLMDAVSYLSIGVPAIPTFGMARPDDERITTMLELGVDTVTIGYDNDEKGVEGSLKVYPYYKKWFDVKGHWAVARVRKSGFKDANEALVGGVF